MGLCRGWAFYELRSRRCVGLSVRCPGKIEASNPMMLRTCRPALQNNPRLACLVAGLAACLGFQAGAWEGHEWSQWRQATTWEKPASHTDQAGRRDLAPLLGGENSATNSPESLRHWEDRRK